MIGQGKPIWHQQPMIRGFALLIVVLAAVASAFVYVQGQRLKSESCMDVPREDLELREMGEIRKIVRSWKSHPKEDLIFESRQMSWVLREVLKLPIHLSVANNEASAQVAMPARSGCYNVLYEGGIEVDQGTIFITPKVVKIGAVNAGSFLGKKRQKVSTEWFSPEQRQILNSVESLQIEGTKVILSLSDPSVIP